MQKQITFKNPAFSMQENLNSLKQNLTSINKENFSKYFVNSTNLSWKLPKGVKILLFDTLKGREYEQNVVIDTLINVINKTNSTFQVAKICYCLKNCVQKILEEDEKDPLFYPFSDAISAINKTADKNSVQALDIVLNSIKLMENRDSDWKGELSKMRKRISKAETAKEIIIICRAKVPIREEQDDHGVNFFFASLLNSNPIKL